MSARVVSPTPPAAARPKNSSSSITSSHAASSSQQPASMASSSKVPRGSTPTASRSAVKVADGEKPARPASKDSLKQKMAKKADDAPRPSKSEEQLRALKTEFDSLRQHLTCKICDCLLYQPYTISCGHTYCYSCLCTWFVNNKSKKTCPDCRILVTQLPAPAYVIRDMTNVFIGRAQLLPPGETIEDHAKKLKEEADAVQQDKDNNDPRTGGLFKGCFRAQPHHARGPSLHAIRDQEDGIDRCPVCSWELEEGECQQCGLFFDDNGELAWGDSFAGFSDMDEMSERDMSGEDLDAEMEDEYDDYGEPMDGWPDYLPDDGSYMMRRWFEHGLPPQAAFARRHRPMTHSEAGSRRSYSQSIVSDMYTEEMDTVEEEDEEELDEDSSMNDFIDDGAIESENSTSASSTPAQTPQPATNRAAVRARARRVVESETSSTISSVIEEEDEEDEGPIRRGQRNRAQTRILNRANGSREPSGPPSSTSTDVSTEELDEDTQALLQAEGWMLQHDGPDDEMGEDDLSDGARTTVGWDATAISNDRVRLGGSLTPTADRPRPNAPIRPPSRVGNTRFMNASRGLRRRSSALSTSTVNYEDGEADDDDSDIDQDGDIAMAMNSLRSRRSRAQMRNSATFPNPNNRFANRGLSQGDAVDLDTDDNSDTSQPGNRRNTTRTRRQEYDPRISWMFADHQRALQEYQRGASLMDLEPRSTTPIARPRTANRNRPSPAQMFSPFMPPAPTRLRTPLMDNSSNIATGGRGPISPPRRSVLSPTLPTMSGADSTARVDNAPSVGSSSNGSAIPTPGTSMPTSQHSVNSVAQAQAAAAMDMIDRPPSRVSARPPSATGRRNSAGFSPGYSGFPHNNVGLNMGGRIFPQQASGNPWGNFLQPRGIRSRNSRPVLRDQSSTATLRPANSRANIRDGTNPPQGIRTQASRIGLRSQPSQRRLSNQASTRTLRASDHARPPQSPTVNTAAAPQPTARPTRFTPAERDRLARELINTRTQALGQPPAAPTRTNPFASGYRRPSNASEAPTMTVTTGVPQHTRNNSTETVNSTNSSNTAQATPSSPGLGRRRSSRNIAPAPSGALPPAQPTFSAPSTAYGNNYFRSRQGSFTGTGPAYESPLNANTRGMSPMVAGPLI